MTTIQYASDLHLEFAENEFFMRNNPLTPGSDVLLLAGDIIPFSLLKQYEWFFDYVADNFKTTYWIAGNHEYYHDDLFKKRGSFCECIRDNVFLVNDHAVTEGNARLIFSTLWTNIRTRNQIAIERSMNDFHLIRYNGNRLTSQDLNQEHNRSFAFIEYELGQDRRGLTPYRGYSPCPDFY